MKESGKSYEVLMRSLEEKSKELNCIYEIEEIFNSPDDSPDKILTSAALVITKGMRFPELAKARIVVDEDVYDSPGWKLSQWFISADIRVQDETAGTITVAYTEKTPDMEDEVFLPEENRLLTTIADRTGHFIFHRRLKSILNNINNKSKIEVQAKPEWEVVLEMLKTTDRNLFSILARKMLNHMFCKGITEAGELFARMGSNPDFDVSVEINSPSKRQVLENLYNIGLEIYYAASGYFSGDELRSLIHKWINEEKASYLVKALANLNTSLYEISDAVRKYYQIGQELENNKSPTSIGIKASLIRKFFTDQLEYINIAKNYSAIEDFFNLSQRIIISAESHGKLGGKSAGIFLAQKILRKASEYSSIFDKVKVPKTWHITSDGLMNFIYYNNLEDIIEQKYKTMDEIRQEYPHIIQAFKNSHFSPEILNGLSRALDDFGEVPIIVRSSSLLEDRMGSAFAGKYKSLFLANQGKKSDRLEALVDAIAEVYASTFGPDPIGYRSEKGFLDFNEEMGIMIQEVVGKKAGNYYFPAFAGVAFSFNEFRWSPRIKREDGLIRMVAGLGTRAVDRVGNDYPVLVAPGRPELRLSLTAQDMLGYAPKFIDVINLRKNTFETIEISQMIKEIGSEFPMLNELFSIIDDTHLRAPVGLGINVKHDDIIVTCDNLINKTDYIKTIREILTEINTKMGMPVDIEFACDGESLFLLQCRPQSSSIETASAVIPTDIEREKIVFTANRYVSNGSVPDIAYIVYIDPEEYSKLANYDDYINVGTAVSKLNKMLPRKTFILMGPGRWGSRDEVKLGVKVTYSDINNTAVLIEIAKTKGSYTPDLSFGTHFFQDLVEAQIRYLPLYPDDENTVFNEDFLRNCENTLTRYLPEYSDLSSVVKVINVREATSGNILRVLFNADKDQALAMISGKKQHVHYESPLGGKVISESYSEPLQWRLRMAESIALKMDPERFGIEAVYLYGTVFNETAGPKSDIDLLVHFKGSDDQLREFKIWLEGWNLCLSQINFNRSGYSVENILDVTILNDHEIKEQKYYAELINPLKHNSKKLKLRPAS